MFDVLICDTAGRLQNKVNLMNELEKVKRVIQREVPGAPHEVLLVLDATTGQNALSQAKTFGKATDVTGIVLTKLDGTAKGGIVLAIRHELDIPVKYVGLGEQVDDLQPFDADQFVYGLFKELIEAPEEQARYLEEQLNQQKLKTNKLTSENDELLQAREHLKSQSKTAIEQLGKAEVGLEQISQWYRDLKLKDEQKRNQYQKKESKLYEAYQFIQKCTILEIHDFPSIFG